MGGVHATKLARASTTVILAIILAIFIAGHSPVSAGGVRLADAPEPRTTGYKPGLWMDEYRADASSAVIAIHGGGWWRGSRAQMADICQLVVLPAGLDCFAPDYTLSTTGAYPAANADVRDAVAYVRSLGYEKVGALGVSAGGTLAGWLADRGKVETAVMWSAPTDLFTLADWYPEGCECWAIQTYVPSVSKREAASPTLNTSQDMASVLMFHSEGERLIPLQQARAFKRAIPEGVERRLIVLPGSAHGLEYVTEAAADTTAWLIEHL